MSYAIIGFGSIGRAIAKAFARKGIEVSVATTRDRDAATVDFLRDTVEELKASGFVADALARAGRQDVTVAPPA